MRLGKRRLSMILGIVLTMSQTVFCSAEIPDSPEGAQINIITEHIEHSRDYADENGVLQSVAKTGEVDVNDLEVCILVNTGLVHINEGIINSSLMPGCIDINNGTVGLMSGELDVNNGTAVIEHGGHVGQNNGMLNMRGDSSLDSNSLTGTVYMMTDQDGQIPDAVETNKGLVISAITTDGQNAVYTPPDLQTGRISCAVGVTYDYGDGILLYDSAVGTIPYNRQKPMTCEEKTLLSPDNGQTLFGHSAVWLTRTGVDPIYGEHGQNEGKIFRGGETIEVDAPMLLTRSWEKTIQADIFFTDDKGVFEGKIFLIDQPIDRFQNVSCNAAYLIKDTDYRIEAVNGITKIELTEQFFRTYGNGPVAVAPLFAGAIYYLYAVNR